MDKLCCYTWTTEYKKWTEFSKQFANKIKYAKLGRFAGHHAYHAMWMAKFRHSAPVMGLTIKQIQQIKQKVVGPSLLAAGVSSKMPRTVVFGPSKYSWTIIIYTAVLDTNLCGDINVDT